MKDLIQSIYREGGLIAFILIPILATIIVFAAIKYFINNPSKIDFKMKTVKYEEFDMKTGKPVWKLSKTFSEWMIEVNELIRKDAELYGSKAPSMRVFREFYDKALLPSEVIKEIKPVVRKPLFKAA